MFDIRTRTIGENKSPGTLGLQCSAPVCTALDREERFNGPAALTSYAKEHIVDSRVLPFPHDATPARRLAKRPARNDDAESHEDVPRPAASDGGAGPQLKYSRPANFRVPMSLRAQAAWIAAQVDWEMARRVDRETAERHRTNLANLPYRGPMQAMEITMRHRLLDAILGFGRPA